MFGTELLEHQSGIRLTAEERRLFYEYEILDFSSNRRSQRFLGWRVFLGISGQFLGYSGSTCVGLTDALTI